MRIKNGQQILNTDPVAWENQYQKEGRFGQRFLWLSLKTIPQMPLKEALAAIDLFLGNVDIHPCLKAQDSYLVLGRSLPRCWQRAMSDPGSVERFLIA